MLGFSGGRGSWSYRERQAAAARRFRRTILILLIFVLYLSFSNFLFIALLVDSSSMTPGLKPGDRVLYSRIFMEASRLLEKNTGKTGIKRGTLVVISPPWYREETGLFKWLNPAVRFFTLQKVGLGSRLRYDWEQGLMIKRVVAIPGDTIKIRNYEVFIKSAGSSVFRSEKKLIGPYELLIPELSPLWHNLPSFRGNTGEITLEEGQYYVLGDSRGQGNDSLQWGALKEEQILGQVFLRYWPFKTFSLF